MTATATDFSAGDIARDAGCPVSRVQYIIRTRRLEPVRRVGVFGLYSEADRQFILSELRRIARERGEHVTT